MGNLTTQLDDFLISTSGIRGLKAFILCRII